MIDTYIKRHELFLEDLISTTPTPAPQIHKAMYYSLFPGGKRIRPVLVYLAGELLDIDLNVLDIIAASIELTHCYSLIHDDLPAMDNDDLRRGKPSCHKAFDEATAILTGDGMQGLAIEVLLTKLPFLLDTPQVVSITRLLVKASGVSGMVSGQSLDLSELAKSSVSEAQLRQIHLLKTGRLIISCFEMVLAAKIQIPDEFRNALITYAEHIGLVFQMQDDYLDFYGADDILGKGRSSDMANQKTTFATLLTKSQLEAEIKNHYQMALGSLSLFKDKAIHLVELTKALQQRTRLNN
ncbi:MAG TPA: polyprenyl synthetase family protein [Legionella sp.]|nr:polyprenyl synthetase family protein [Legionella sp.]